MRFVGSVCDSEASAVIRRSGSWSAQIGPANFILRLMRAHSGSLVLERKLGMLASCAGNLAMTVLEEAGIQAPVVRVMVRGRLPQAGIQGLFEETLVRVSIECEVDERTARSLCEPYLRSHPVISALTGSPAAIKIVVETHSSIHLRM